MKHLLAFALSAALLSSRAHGQTVALRLDSLAHQRSVLAFQQALNEEFRNPNESPLTPAEQQALTSLPFYPTRYGYYVAATFVRDSTSRPFAMETSTARRPTYRKYGELRFMLDGKPRRLSVYQNYDLLKRPGLEDYLFLPFTDLTNGHGSYGGGRYIDLRIPPRGTTVMQIDFNKAYNPSCAYNHGYSCPVPPPENRLSVAIPVGVQSDH
ncbi:DUF1684 domain-containing protein [Hymenobacter convexus]|uniref:DUF1684 domain-containing protein n=1 Tax=Hymenobacter sp. CA1UV-4 TaxID=3063782 RepID=UPI002713E207|nr:DUF1684 domain-containing protein [Hymenobacter sp. CA1UV-4]MDO7850037.1 DUF1684 domain-containing protein [Hymenobacter sp. CA1UV-4]